MIDWIELKKYSKSLLENTLTLMDKIEVEPTDLSIKLNSTSLKKMSNEEIKIFVEQAFATIDYNPVYCIQIAEHLNKENIAEAFQQAKATKVHNRSYSKFNHYDSSTLYVGISQGKSIKKRIREHLGVGSQSTYALNLKHWIPENTDIEILIYKASVPQSSLNHMNLLELMEQALWDKLKPMMGKRSGQL